ncbi:MAG: fatty acid desaturase [Betaproteobacteria bacterium]|nr:fatty acid desaturase [Betaproteobacteria bacterium]
MQTNDSHQKEFSGEAYSKYFRDKSHLRFIQKEIISFIGHENLKFLHSQNLFLDCLAIILVISGFIGCIVGIYYFPIGVHTVFLMILEGLFLTLMGLINHDLFVHRRPFGSTGSWIGSIFLTTPLGLSSSGYAQTHLAHHMHIGTRKDTEVYKQDLDTSLKRLFFCTFIGFKLATNGLWAREKRPRYFEVRVSNKVLRRRSNIESVIRAIFFIGVGIGCFLIPKLFLVGYVLPAIIMVPIWNSLRIIIEHGEVNPDNPWHNSTYYRTGFITRPIFLWDSGDCHLIHHLFPAIPFYRISRAIELIDPILQKNGVISRHSYIELLKGWFIDCYEHRSLWPKNLTEAVIVKSECK